MLLQHDLDICYIDCAGYIGYMCALNVAQKVATRQVERQCVDCSLDAVHIELHFCEVQFECSLHQTALLISAV